MSEPLYLRCHCSTAYHFVTIEGDPDAAGMFNMAVVSSKSWFFWHRVRIALRYVFRLDHLIEGEVILTAAEFHRMLKFIGDATA